MVTAGQPLADADSREGDIWTFNGIDASSGSYLLRASPAELARVARKTESDPHELSELKIRHTQTNTSHFGVKAGIDVRDLATSGWGVVFAAVKPGSPEAARQAAIREALAPLLEHRRTVASRRCERHYREYTGTDGLRPQESKLQFLARHGAGPGPVDPDIIPYYMLLVGDPREIPFRFQSQLGVQFAVGRICFDTLDEYANYARNVVSAETRALTLARRLTCFSVANPDDTATHASANSLITPLIEALVRQPTLAGWSIDQVAREEATRDALVGLLARGNAPALLFTACHGIGFPSGHPLQRSHQGALLCQDWPGPRQWGRRPIPETHYFAGEHLPEDADLSGTVAFLFACYGAGTPEYDEYPARPSGERARLATEPFIAALPKAMLGRAKGGALAVIGHVDRAWSHSFLWRSGPQQRPQITVFASALQAMMQGAPVGAAMTYFAGRYAELASELSVQLEKAEFGEPFDELAIAGMWTANNDARGYAVLGDPAVRVMAEDPLNPRRVLKRTVFAAETMCPAKVSPSETQGDTTTPVNVAVGEHAASADDRSVSVLAVHDFSAAVLHCLRELPESEVTSREADGVEIVTRARLGGAIESTFVGSHEPSATLRGHHEAMVREALAGQARVLELLLRSLTES